MSFNSEPIRHQPLGAVNSYDVLGQGIELHCEFSILRVTIFSPTVFQIEIGGAETLPSYSLVALPTECSFDHSEKDGIISVSTGCLELQIEKATTRLTFLKEGKVISEEDSFGTSCIGSTISTYKKIQDGERFIGLGEKTGNLDRRGSGYTHWNVDAFGYSPDDDPLYCSTPFYMGLHHDLVYGIFLDNPARSGVNFGASNDRFSSISVEAGNLNYFFIG